MADPVLAILANPSPTIIHDLKAALAQFPPEYLNVDQYLDSFWYDAHLTAIKETRELWLHTALTKELPHHADVIRLLGWENYYHKWGDAELRSHKMFTLSIETAIDLVHTKQFYLLLYWAQPNAMPSEVFLAAFREWKKMPYEQSEIRQLIYNEDMWAAFFTNRWTEKERLVYFRELLGWFRNNQCNWLIDRLAERYESGEDSLDLCRCVVLAWGVHKRIKTPRAVYMAIARRDEVSLDLKRQPFMDVTSCWKMGPCPDWLDRDMLADVPADDMRLQTCSEARAEWQKACAWRIVAMVSCLGESDMAYFRIRDVGMVRRHLRAVRFFYIARRLPLDLQVVLALRVMGSTRQTIPPVPIFAARWVFGLWTWPEAYVFFDLARLESLP